MNKKLIEKAYAAWMGECACAITIVFNQKNVGLHKGYEAIREFHRLVDRDRFGGRYYERPERERLWFRVSPEKWDDHPHFHGLIVLPKDQVAAEGFDAVREKYAAFWSELYPNGSLRIEALHDGPGWVSYASKENSLTSSLTVIDSHLLSPKEVWAPQRD
ncbi:MAG: hypothetical protein ACT6RD_00145 [Brevundimonas sp.]|uniref:hypothetical protein n=1 Tax=Brevundimonas sp. TaxID=1871086 RepID=UPI004034BC81